MLMDPMKDLPRSSSSSRFFPCAIRGACSAFEHVHHRWERWKVASRGYDPMHVREPDLSFRIAVSLPPCNVARGVVE